jgi:DMSO/TMAO reductase YedYZ molybdopterin-dependent catalytic subunit
MTIERKALPRRTFIKGLTSSAGLILAGCANTEPPTYGNLLRMGDLLTYKAHRLLLPGQALAREYEHDDITAVMAVGTTNPADPEYSIYSAEYGPVYERLLANGFAGWRLVIEGSVERPGTFSLEDLQRMPSRTQITRHVCEEGWSAIAQWTGVPLHHVLKAVGIKPEARYVQFHSYDDIADGIDMFDALHPQTILAYGMNGRHLPISHGAPLRVRVETQLGYKSMKFLRGIVVTEAFDDHGSLGNIQNGWAWYAGI